MSLFYAPHGNTVVRGNPAGSIIRGSYFKPVSLMLHDLHGLSFGNDGNIRTMLGRRMFQSFAGNNDDCL